MEYGIGRWVNIWNLQDTLAFVLQVCSCTWDTASVQPLLNTFSQCKRSSHCQHVWIAQLLLGASCTMTLST